MTILKHKVVVSIRELSKDMKAMDLSHSSGTNKTKVVITLSCIEVKVVTMSSKLANPRSRRKYSKSVQQKLIPDS